MERCSDCGQMAVCEQYGLYVAGELTEIFWVCHVCSYCRQRLEKELGERKA